MTTLSAQLCTPEEQTISARANAPLHCLTRDESIALAFVTQAGVMSLLACLVTYALIVRNICRHARQTPGRWRLIRVPMDIYLLSLFAADIVLSIGGVINAKWVRDGKSQRGGWCSAQAVSLSVGTITVAVNTLAIAIHTFVMIWWNKGLKANFVAWIAVAAPWIYSVSYLAIVGWIHRHEPNGIFRPTPYWCWIGNNYLIHRLFAGYVWMWMALIVSLLLYVPLFFWGRGNITVGDKIWNFQIHQRGRVDDSRGSRPHSLSMIAYPLVYACLVLPLSIGRWIGFEQENTGDKINRVPAGATIAVHVIYCLSGISNVLLFLLTRPNLLLFPGIAKTFNHANASAPSGDTDSIEGGEEKTQ